MGNINLFVHYNIILNVLLRFNKNAVFVGMLHQSHEVRDSLTINIMQARMKIVTYIGTLTYCGTF